MLFRNKTDCAPAEGDWEKVVDNYDCAPTEGYSTKNRLKMTLLRLGERRQLASCDQLEERNQLASGDLRETFGRPSGDQLEGPSALPTERRRTLLNKT